ncbi:MAG: polysaccharide deacetylase family protein [Planctomycetes bacterium]|nr:polysaccharide deacetylase family protein [Planctomycetota bacterium]
MRWKRWARDAIDYCADRFGILARHVREMRDGITVLMYHRVLPPSECNDYPFPTLVMPSPFFRDQVSWLAANCTVLPLCAALPLAGRARERPLVALTFDDGYADNFEHAAAIIEEHGVRGSFYVTTGACASGALLWFDEAALFARSAGIEAVYDAARRCGFLASSAGRPWRSLREFIEALKTWDGSARIGFIAALRDRFAPADDGPHAARRFRLMTREQVRDLHGRGHECGSHTVHHALLPRLSRAEAERELRESKAWLEETTGEAARGFCYPNGDASTLVRALVAEAGYDYACGTRPGRNRAGSDRYMLRRIDVTPQRVVTSAGHYSERAFRAEASLFHAWMR